VNPFTSKPVTPEKAVQNGVVSALRFHNWMVQRNQQGIGNTKGRPDIEAYKKGFALFIEIKKPKHRMENGKMSPGGKLSDDQQKYIAKLRAQDMIVVVTDDAEKFLDGLEELQEQLWPGKNIRRLC
jgi:hypothetical protein